MEREILLGGTIVKTRKGTPTPDDIDELLTPVWKKPAFFLAHPKAIAAFGREATRRGVPPATVRIPGSQFIAWRGIPIVPSNKLAIDAEGKTSILLLRAESCMDYRDPEKSKIAVKTTTPSELQNLLDAQPDLSRKPA